MKSRALVVLNVLVLWAGFMAASVLASDSLVIAKPKKSLPAIRVSSDGHYFELANGKPFFWLGDTAWELIHRLTIDESNYYLTTRANQGYTIIQTVVLAEMDGIKTPTPEGFTPFVDADPTKPNPLYFDKVEKIIARANELGLYVALLPTWADKMTAPWGEGPRIFTTQNTGLARAYGAYLGQRLKGYNNIVWMLGGDRPGHIGVDSNDYLKKSAEQAGFSVGTDWRPIWNEMAEGIKSGYGNSALFGYHTNGGPEGTTVEFKDTPWLGFNGRQSGHGGGHDVPIWESIQADFLLKKPTLDLEPNYEDHPYNPWPTWDPATGYFDDYDVRKQTYRSVFAGAAGVTYGHHSVWQFASAKHESINHVIFDWATALQRPAGRQMQFLRALIESRPMLERIPDPSMIKNGQGEGGSHVVATRDQAGSYAFIYFPARDQRITVDLSQLKAQQINAWWFDPRTGVGHFIDKISHKKQMDFKSPPRGPDWVLVLDDAQARFSPPGLR